MLTDVRIWLQGKKTYILGAIAVLTGIAELVGIDVVPDVDASNALNYIWAGLGMATLRAGIGSDKQPPVDGSQSGV